MFDVETTARDAQFATSSKFPAVSEHMTPVGWNKVVLDQATCTRQLRRRKRTIYPWLARSTKASKPSLLFLASKIDVSAKASPAQGRQVQHFLQIIRRWSKRVQLADPLMVAAARTDDEGQVFLPSMQLASCWKASMVSHIEGSVVRDEIRELLPEQSMDEIRQVFSLRLRRTVGALGNRLRFGQLDYDSLSAEGALLPAFQYEILDRFHVVPDKSGLFFFLLERDLRTFLARGGKLGGSWGTLRLNEGSIQMSVTVSEAPTSDWQLAAVSD